MLDPPPSLVDHPAVTKYYAEILVVLKGRLICRLALKIGEAC